MSELFVPSAVAVKTVSEALDFVRKRAVQWNADDVRVPAKELTDAVLEDLAGAAERANDGTFGRVIAAIVAARQGSIKKIPSFNAAPEIFVAYLKEALIDGWLYKQGTDGYLHPRLVVDIGIEDSRSTNPPERRIVIKMTSDYPFGKSTHDRGGSVTDSIRFEPSDVARKAPHEALFKAGYVRESPELKAAYEERRARFEEIMATGFAKQYRFTGTPRTDNYRTENPRANRKVIHDVRPSELLSLRDSAPSELVADDQVLPVPVETQLRVFDTKAHEFWTVNTADLTDYVYDKTLREKLVLPDDQRELLDVLTSDLGAFAADIIEGKSAGNVVLAKGQPGVGKTLTAEVYSEIVERPLYSIHSGVLGTTAPDVRQNLEVAFERAQRWNAVLLLDEADVFVLARGNNIAQNAICAEFLRTLEYFDGLLFMTTNRSDDIDDAIISRCAALIDYKLPDKDDATKIWRVLAKQMGVNEQLTPPLLDQLVRGLPDASPRDMKMLLRLTLRMAASRGEELSADLFARCAMFRGLHFNQKD